MVRNRCRELSRPGIAPRFHYLAMATPDKPLVGFYLDDRLRKTVERWDDLVAARWLLREKSPNILFQLRSIKIQG
jgi:hypothetical protein